MTPVREAMIRASKMLDQSKSPETYKWTAIWWRLHSMESKDPATCLKFSKQQYALYKDIKARPKHYRMKLKNKTDYQWSQYESKTV